MSLPDKQLRVAGRTHPGAVRQHNEDSFIVDETHGICIVADGMGGEKGGDVASSMATAIIHERLLARSGQENIGELLAEAFLQANLEIFQRAAEDVNLKGMGTTVVAVLAIGSALHWAHVGDSRLYLYHDGTLSQITEDHNLIRQLEKEGVISPGSDASKRYRNVLSRAVGTSETVVPDTGVVELVAGDLVILCTDGLSEMVADEEVAAILQECGEDLEFCCDRLIEEAMECGGRDNVTVVVSG